MIRDDMQAVRFKHPSLIRYIDEESMRFSINKIKISKGNVTINYDDLNVQPSVERTIKSNKPHSDFTRNMNALNDIRTDVFSIHDPDVEIYPFAVAFQITGEGIKASIEAEVYSQKTDHRVKTGFMLLYQSGEDRKDMFTQLTSDMFEKLIWETKAYIKGKRYIDDGGLFPSEEVKDESEIDEDIE